MRLLGAIDEHEKAFWLGLARGYVMPKIEVPNDSEGFCISVLEAIAFGLPVFTTGIEGIADQMRYCHSLERLLEDPLPRPHTRGDHPIDVRGRQTSTWAAHVSAR